MKHVLIFVLAASSCAFAQDGPNITFQTTQGMAWISSKAGTVQGAPYSATVTNESIQTLADGNRIVQSGSGAIARDSQGRTRQDTALPAIGNLAAANAPHLVFIQDPVAQVSYTLDLTDKTAQKVPMPPAGTAGAMVAGGGGAVAAGGADAFYVQMGTNVSTSGPLPPPLPPVLPPPVAIQKTLVASDPSQLTAEDLGSQTMEGVLVNGVRTTHTIPAGQIGNDLPITVVTEVWTSPDLKTVVYSKRSDPRMGEQTFRLTNIVRTEPSPSLFSVPADFKIVDGPQPIFYRTKQ